jgi:Fe-S-cluster-containing hydrogenase component 2
MYAARNIALCNKDCVCLFVCPTGATDTEDGQIDRDRCVEGCRACVDACPAHAIYLVMQNYPEPPLKNAELSKTVMEFCARKSAQEGIAGAVAQRDANPVESRIARALARSCRILAEDCAREAGYMTPQCRATGELLEKLATESDGEVKSIVGQLIQSF